MKTLKSQLFLISSILLCILATLVAIIINSAFEEKKFAEEYAIKNQIAGYLNTAAEWQAIERGIGATILGSGDASPLFSKFIEMGKKGDTKVLHIKQLTEKWGTKAFSEKLNQWLQKYEQVKRARPKIANGSISKDEWLKITTANINLGFSLRHLAFVPQNKKEQIQYLNNILRPNIARLCEFAGLERALVANTIARGDSFSTETLNKIKWYRFIVEESIEQVLLGETATSNEISQAIVTFEKEFLHSFEQLRQKVFAASLKGMAYPVDATTWFESATKAINTGWAISKIAGEQANTFRLDMELAAKRNMIITWLLLFLVLLIFSLFILWSKNHILIPIQKLIDSTQKVANGDFFHQIAIDSENEIGKLEIAFNKMTDDLRISTLKIFAAKEQAETANKAKISATKSALQ